MRHTTPIFLALVALLVTTALPAAAGTEADPELTDPCGVEDAEPVELATNHAPPWADICTAWFETLTGEEGPPAIRLTITFAGDITERPVAAAYGAGFWVGECRYAVERVDEGATRLHADPPGDRLSVRCPAAVEPECPHPAPVGCGTAYDTTTYPLPDGAVAEDGNRLTATLVFAEGLARWAPEFAEGAELRSLSITAAGFQGVVAGGYCAGSTCGSNGADSAQAQRAYVVEPGDGPAVSGPTVPVGFPGCAAGTVAEGSAERPHFADPEADYGTVVRTPEADNAAYDLKAAWFSEVADGGVAVSVLPWGTDHTPGHLRYTVDFNGWTVALEEAADGSWAGRVHVQRYISDPEWLTADDPMWATEVAYDAATGQVTTVLPEDVLPAVGGELQMTQVTSMETPTGAVDPVWVVGTIGVDPGAVSVSVDHSQNGQACTAVR